MGLRIDFVNAVSVPKNHFPPPVVRSAENNAIASEGSDDHVYFYIGSDNFKRVNGHQESASSAPFPLFAWTDPGKIS